MNVRELSNIELATRFVNSYAGNECHDEEREELERRGLEHVTINSAVSELTESAIEQMDEAELYAAIEDAAKELADALNSTAT